MITSILLRVLSLPLVDSVGEVHMTSMGPHRITTSDYVGYMLFKMALLANEKISSNDSESETEITLLESLLANAQISETQKKKLIDTAKALAEELKREGLLDEVSKFVSIADASGYHPVAELSALIERGTASLALRRKWLATRYMLLFEVLPG